MAAVSSQRVEQLTAVMAMVNQPAQKSIFAKARVGSDISAANRKRASKIRRPKPSRGRGWPVVEPRPGVGVASRKGPAPTWVGIKRLTDKRAMS